MWGAEVDVRGEPEGAAGGGTSRFRAGLIEKWGRGTNRVTGQSRGHSPWMPGCWPSWKRWRRGELSVGHARLLQLTTGVIRYHTSMSSAKIAITLDPTSLRTLDRLVRRGVFPSRSRAIQEAVTEKLSRLERRRLAEECAKLDPVFEQALADEGLALERGSWPAY